MFYWNANWSVLLNSSRVGPTCYRESSSCDRHECSTLNYNLSSQTPVAPERYVQIKQRKRASALAIAACYVKYLDKKHGSCNGNTDKSSNGRDTHTREQKQDNESQSGNSIPLLSLATLCRMLVFQLCLLLLAHSLLHLLNAWR